MNLLSIDSNAKLAKTTAVYGTQFLIAGLSMMPNNRLCPGSKAAGCMEGCLKSAGRGSFSNVQAGRQRKTDWFESDKAGFVATLVDDLERLVRKAKREGKHPAVRLNVLSDVKWEQIECERGGQRYKGIPQAFPEIQFYDYTKVGKRTAPANYHLTFSYSHRPEYRAQVLQAELSGYNLAVVFNGYLPDEFLGRRVIDGDTHDLRFLDDDNVIVGLVAKGKARKDTSGFVVNPELIEIAS